MTSASCSLRAWCRSRCCAFFHSQWCSGSSFSVATSWLSPKVWLTFWSRTGDHPKMSKRWWSDWVSHGCHLQLSSDWEAGRYATYVFVFWEEKAMWMNCYWSKNDRDTAARLQNENVFIHVYVAFLYLRSFCLWFFTLKCLHVFTS